MKKNTVKLALFLVIIMVFIGSCSPTPDQIEQAYQEFGGRKAFQPSTNGGAPLKIKNPSTAKTFNLGGLPTEYLTAAREACVSLNKVSTQLNINNSTNSNTSGDWRVTTHAGSSSDTWWADNHTPAENLIITHKLIEKKR